MVKIERFIKAKINNNNTMSWEEEANKSWIEAAMGNGIPMGESDEEIIAEIDPSLEYTGHRFNTVGSYIYVVNDPTDGLEKILKVAAAPAKVSIARYEHEVLDILNKAKVKGIPKVFRFYNSVGSERDSQKFTAMLREYVDAQEFDEELRSEETYKRLFMLASDLNHHGVTLPKDFNSSNVLVDKNNQPYFIDLEESTLNSGPIFETQQNYQKIKMLLQDNVMEHLQRSKKPILRMISKDRDMSKFIANLFYAGPLIKNKYLGRY